jgi:hypothetical protein
MGNEGSAPGRQGQAPRLSVEEHKRLEGKLYVIFPHMVAVEAHTDTEATDDDVKDNETSAGDGAKAAEAEAGGAAAEAAEVGHVDADGDDEQQEKREEGQPRLVVVAPQPQPTRPPRLPSWAAMAEVLQRDITDLAALHQGAASPSYMAQCWSL